MGRVRTLAAHPLVLALILTLANAAKPVLIDDPAYLAFARHLAKNPFEPYAFELFWYDRPQPAMEIVLPPVLPYWLAAGMALFGEHLLLLKLWLLPFAAILAYAVRSLARRFSPAGSMAVTVMLTIGPGSLPFFNFMLDLPALALQFASIALALRAMDAPRFRFVAFASGCALALALQTKYSVLGLPPAILFAGSLLRAKRIACGIVLVGLILFSGWELAVAAVHGRSHFLIHTFGYAKSASLQGKVVLAFALAGQLGLLALWGLLSALTWRRTLGWLAVGIGIIAFAQDAATTLSIAFVALGLLVLVATGRFALPGAIRSGASVEARFLAGWLALEILVYFAVVPFPAGRRILGIAVVVGLILARAVPLRPWALVVGLAIGASLTLLDAWDADAERTIPDRATVLANERGLTGTGYFIGHWGLQYYAERRGLKLIDPATTTFEPGDWILLPVGERPQTGGYHIEPDPTTMEWIATLIEDDSIPLRTIAHLYAARTPVAIRTDVRMHCDLYRVTAACRPKVIRP